eukprot:13840838-Alexandrium_andersonii.AAC.1
MSPPKLPRGALGTVLRADSESADETGDRGGPSREIANLQAPIRNPRNPWLLAREKPANA